MRNWIRTESGELVPRVSRRDVLAWGGRMALGLAMSPVLFKAVRAWWPEETGTGVAQAQAAADGLFWDSPGMSPEITPTDRFYTVSKNLFDPAVDVKSWQLTVDGLVHRPFTVDYQTLTSGAGMIREYVTLTCISNEVGGDLAGNAQWGGVRLRDVLQQAGVQEGAVDLAMEAEDGYTDSIPMAKAMHEDTLLVWEMNGAPLTPSHGFPIRLVVPGIYGMKSVKWLKRLTVVNYDYLGYWARRGWSDEAPIKTWSRFDIPKRYVASRDTALVLGGVAFAGDRGIARVELSVNGGPWQGVALKPALAKYAWRLWAVTWRPPARGSYRLQVRAVDNTGAVQDALRRPPLPDGATGYHGFTMRVV